jgi:hypothetical protein
MKNTSPFKDLGIGLGLRIPHYSYIFANKPKIDFFEIISENFMVEGGPPLENLKKILDHYPVVQHGVSLSLASAEETDWEYIKKLKKLTQITKTPYFTDHLCWTRFNSHNFHDLLPIPYTEEYALFIAEKAKIIQDKMGIPFGIENLSTYVAFESSEMEEWEFYNLVVEKSGCYMMLDINNIFVSARNHNFDARIYLDSIKWDRVLQCHIAGPTERADGTFVDTHDSPVRPEVWDLYQYAWQVSGGFATLLEWDDKIPSFLEVHQEALKALNFQKVKTHV